MAALENDHLVVRVAYTGPPMAGKTQSVRALLPLLNGKATDQQVMSPGEWRGRTAFFDWAYYEGGAFEGRPIRCQIISTPGQVALSDRRELILRSADAVILVVDSQLDAIERAIQCYEEMAPWLADAGRDTPIRVLLSCNKQDLEGSVPPEELSRALGLPFGKEVYSTSARTGKGLRAAFVAGVRVAVERARALLAKGEVLTAPAVRTGEELYELMQRDAALRSAESPLGMAVGPSSSVPSERTTRRMPVSSAPSQGTASSSVRAPRPRSVSASRPPWSRLLSGKPSEAPSAPPSSATDGRVSAPVASAPVASAPSSVRSERPRASATAVPKTTRKRAPATLEGQLPTSAQPATAQPATAQSATAQSATAQPATAQRATAQRATAQRATAQRATAQRAAARTEAAVESTPRGSTRHAMRPSRSVLIESKAPEVPAVIEAPSQRFEAALDPGGKAARAWRPESGARPAVMPASAYYALVVPAYEPGASLQTPSTPREPSPLRAADPRPANDSRTTPSLPTAPARSSTTSYVPGGTRPAVMPAGAYYATLRPELPGDRAAFAASAAPASAGETPRSTPAARAAAAAPVATVSTRALPATDSRARSRPQPLASSAPQPGRTASTRARPAVMPASAYYAELRAAGAASVDGDARDARAAVLLNDVASTPPARARAPATKSAAPAGPALKPGARPAVMPASAWRAALEIQPSAPAHERSVALVSSSPERDASDASRARVPRHFADHPGRAANETGAARGGMRLLAGGSQPLRRADSQALAASARAPLELVKRPAVMPLSAWLGNGSAHSNDTPPAQAQAAEAKDRARPAVMPASAWRALQQMADDMAAAENADATDATASPAPLDDPPTQPSRAILELPGHTTLERALPEPSESFWIPETPPGLRGLSGSAAPRVFTTGESPAHATSSAAPRLPGQAQAPRSVWRRTTWRQLETQITQEGRALEDARGRWIGELAPGWYARTLNSARDLTAARRAFAEEVLRQRRLARYLSEPRCVALTEEPDCFWVWQIACRVPTLAVSLGRLLAMREAPSAMADALIDVAAGYLAARESFAQAPEPLPLSMLTLGVRDGKSVYAGLMPDAGSTLLGSREDSDAAFGDALQKKWREAPASPVSLEELLIELSRRSVGRLPETLLEIIRAALIQN